MRSRRRIRALLLALWTLPTLSSCDRSPQAETTPPPAAPLAPVREPKPAAPSPPADQALSPLKDRGIFSDLDARVQLRCPEWLMAGPLLQVQAPNSDRIWWAFDGTIVCEADNPRAGTESARLTDPHSQDQDKDGIPDAVDILRGAKKAVLNGAAYKNSYRQLSFPGGDVPRTEGVCTDVIVRSLRNTGQDLQELLALDIEDRPAAYPMVKKKDSHIDHRRVRTLLPYFQEHARELTVDHQDSAFPYVPGDVVFMNTMGDAQPEHMGIVSDTLGKSGNPLIINNWTDGTVTQEMDLLGKFDVTHRFRMVAELKVEKVHQGLDGVLRRHGLKVPRAADQILLVTTPLWTSSGGTLTRWERRDGTFRQVGVAQEVRVGRKGLGSGLGFHSDQQVAPQLKKEGDQRAPAGVFHLGTAFGRPKKAPYRGSWPYRAVTARDHWIDDPASPDYNRWITIQPGEKLSWSSEKLTMYSLGLVVEHNEKRPQPGAGSAIFVHPWKSAQTPTVGCTALPEAELTKILSWLDPQKKPVLVQVAGRSY